jgi:hypothetical protein
MLHARLMHVSPLEVFGRSPFSLTQAREVLLGPKQLGRLVIRGEIRRVLQGVYVVADVPDDLALRAAAAALVAPAGTVVCGRTAAWLYGVDALAMGAHRVLPDVDLMVPAGRSAARRAGVLGCSGPLADEDVVHVGAVPVTVPARTAADLARLLPRPDALASLDALLRQGLTTVGEINDVLGQFAGYRGVLQARELTALASPLAESPQESRTRLRCVDAGFPAPEPQVIVRRPDGLFVARLDMGWLDLLRALEYDGDEYHSTPEDLRHDRLRREEVETLGWKVAVVTSREVLGRGLEFERIVAEALAMPYELTRHHPARGGWGA